MLDDFLINDSYDAYGSEYEEKLQLQKELNKYRETFKIKEEINDAIRRRMTPQRPLAYDPYSKVCLGYCPNCGESLYLPFGYCVRCGQMIRWEND